MCGSFLAPKPPTVAPPPASVAPINALEANEVENPEPIFNPGSEIDDMDDKEVTGRRGKDKLKTHDTGLSIPV